MLCNWKSRIGIQYIRINNMAEYSHILRYFLFWPKKMRDVTPLSFFKKSSKIDLPLSHPPGVEFSPDHESVIYFPISGPLREISRFKVLSARLTGHISITQYAMDSGVVSFDSHGHFT